MLALAFGLVLVGCDDDASKAIDASEHSLEAHPVAKPVSREQASGICAPARATCVANNDLAIQGVGFQGLGAQGLGLKGRKTGALRFVNEAQVEGSFPGCWDEKPGCDSWRRAIELGTELGNESAHPLRPAPIISETL
jgi:hypothetical protein